MSIFALLFRPKFALEWQNFRSLTNFLHKASRSRCAYGLLSLLYGAALAAI